MTVPEIANGACVWMPTVEHSNWTKSRRKTPIVTCCACRSKIDYHDSWVTVAYGRNGVKLPLPVFIFCMACSVQLDATAAWMAAYMKDKGASLPDPEKVKREEELNAKMNPFHNPDILP